MSVSRMRNIGGRHGIEATRMPGMAATQAPQREPAAVEDTEAPDRHEGVIRAGGMKAAFWTEQRAQRPLVEADQGCKEDAH